ncbi:hypothetical protein [Puniceibacterium sp. IMCC21224]|uniref:hypothetical protein n=1 Tax=Puniceibacterium sp. IMCC21224 TaxID=1618204 RepID=UPI00064DA6B6|nr:hypothetical protein IMCC21224_13278 [Puniceibacterium sp. IMCC21224]
MYSETEDLVRDLAANAESVCRAYLPAGRREGSYWIVGDLQNNPGRSLFVRLIGPASGPGAAGKFTEHVAARVMLRWRELARFGGGFRGAGQHNLSATGGCS